MTTYRYSAHTESDPSLDLPADLLLDQLAEEFTRHGDLERALRQLVQRGADTPDNGHLDGIQDLLNQLRDIRQDLLDRYNLASTYDTLKSQLDQIVQQERQAIRDRLDDLRQQLRNQPADLLSGDLGDAYDALTRVASRNLAALNALPEDVGGMVAGLRQYDFLDSAARSQFDDFLAKLQQAALDTLARETQQQLERLTPDDLDSLENMLTDLNTLLDHRAAGGDPDLNTFLENHPDAVAPLSPNRNSKETSSSTLSFGERVAPKERGEVTLEQFIDRLHRQASRMQSLLASLPVAQHRALSDLLANHLLRPGLEQELRRLARHLHGMFPNRSFGKQYAFRGDDPLSLQEGLGLMDQLRRIDDLERHLDRVRYGGQLDQIDRQEVEALLGKPAADTMDSLTKLTDHLIEAGFAVREGDTLGLTARGIRHIGQKAMLDIFRRLQKSALGNHTADRRGQGVELADETRAYEFGAPFFLHLERTLMRAAARGEGVPVRLHASDFEVYATEHLTQTSTVIMLDMSRSMPMRGNAHAAKKVTLALHQLIKTQFPRDNLYVVGFSGIAREVKHGDVPGLETADFGRGTNMQAALMIARRLLARHKGSTRQVIMITDGEPTAYFEPNGQVYIEFPPSPRVMRATLTEVQRCTRDGITINTFMLDQTAALRDFVRQLTRMNRGRAFFTGPDRLGEYLLVDYLNHKTAHIT